MFLRRNSSFSIVCSEPKAIMWHFKKDIVFAHYSSCTCSSYRFLASVGLAQARPNKYNAVKMAPASGALNPLIPGKIKRNGGGIEDGIAPRYT